MTSKSSNSAARDKVVNELADECLKYMKQYTVDYIKNNDHTPPATSLENFLSNITMPKDFNYKWNVKNALVDAISILQSRGVIYPALTRSGPYRYRGADIDEALASNKLQKKLEDELINKFCKRYGIEIDKRFRSSSVSIGRKDLIKLIGKLDKREK